MNTFRLIILTAMVVALNVTAGDTMAPAGAHVYIVSPSHGETVSSPFKVVFGLAGMGVAPAGTKKDKTGHHHLLIDTTMPDLNKPIPADANHKHFGGGQTQVVIELTSGKHTLQLLLADFAHVPHNPPVMSEQITITVK